MSVIVPKCKVFTGAGSTWKELCEAFVAWCQEPESMAFMEIIDTATSGGADDRILLKARPSQGDHPQGQIWIGYTNGGKVGFLLDPEETLVDADQPPSGVGSTSPLVERSEGVWNGKILWAEYPDSFLMIACDDDDKGAWMAHGGRTITTWNSSDAPQGITGHGLFTSWGDHAHFNRWEPVSSIDGEGVAEPGMSCVRVNFQEWLGDATPIRTEMKRPTLGGVRAGWPILVPALVGGSNYSSLFGFTRYARRDSATNFFGNMRVSTMGDQAWLCIDHGESAVAYPWFLWDRRVVVL